MASKIKVKLDVLENKNISTQCKQNDDLVLEASIYEGSKELDLTNSYIIIQARKSDLNPIVQDVNIAKLGNTIIAELDREFTKVPGLTIIEIVMIEKGKQNTTFSFSLLVEKSVINIVAESKILITPLERLQNTIIEAKENNEIVKTTINSAKENNEALTNTVNAAVVANVKAEENINNLNLKNTAADTNISTLTLKNTKAEENITNLETKNTEAVTNIAELETKIAAAGEVKAETELLIQNGGAATKGDIAKVNSSLEHNALEIKNVSEDTRIFKPRVYAYLSQGSTGSVTWETYVDEITYREHLNAMKNSGCDGFVLCLQIQPSKEHRDNFDSDTITEDDLIYRAYPSFDNVKLLKKLGDEIGVPLVGIKFHNNWIRDNSKPLTFSKWFEQYTQEAYKFANEFTNIKYFSILNESKTIINTTSNKTKIKTLLDQLKKKGFITGFSGVNDFDSDYENYVNGIFIHTYPTISNKGQFTTYQDGIIGWESYGILETLRKMRKKHPNKTFLISETGVQNYWEALSLPEQNFNANNTLIEDGSPSAIYFYGMFETLKNGDYDFLDSVWLFYTNPIREKTQKIIYKYTNGGVK